MSDVTAKLNQIKNRLDDYREDAKGMILQWEKDLKNAMQVQKLGEHVVIKGMRTELQKKVEDINYVILWDKELTEEKRNRLFDKREIIMWFLSKFDSADKTIESIDESISRELSDK